MMIIMENKMENDNYKINIELSRSFPGMMDGVYELININRNSVKALDSLNRDIDAETGKTRKDKNIEYFILSNLDSVNMSMAGQLNKAYNHLMDMKVKYKGNELVDGVDGDYFMNSWHEFSDNNGLNVTNVLRQSLFLSGAGMFPYNNEEIKGRLDKEMYEYIKERVVWSVTTPENPPSAIIPFMFDYKQGADVLSATRNLHHLQDLSKSYYEEIKKTPQDKQEEIVLYLAEKLLFNPLSNPKENAIFEIFNENEKELIFKKLGSENPHSLVIKRLQDDIASNAPEVKKSPSFKM